MADLDSTIVRGNLRVTEDINVNGNITGNGSGLTLPVATPTTFGVVKIEFLDGVLKISTQ